MSNDAKPPPMVLRAFYLRHGETYTPGINAAGIPPSLSFWDREKHGAHLTVDERQNGDIWLTNARGLRIEISVLAIAYKVRGPVKLEQTDAVRRGA